MKVVWYHMSKIKCKNVKIKTVEEQKVIICIMGGQYFYQKDANLSSSIFKYLKDWILSILRFFNFYPNRWGFLLS